MVDSHFSTMVSSLKILLLFAILTIGFTEPGRTTEPEANPSSLRGLTVCNVESDWEGHGRYEPFDKDPAYIEFANLTLKGNKSFVFVIEKKSEERCDWRIAVALDVGSGLGEQPIESADVVSFNCAVLHQPYKRHTGYFGLIRHGSRDEYVTPERAWSIDLDSMKFAELKTSTVLCPNFLADSP
jgi:hypothetical protein